MFYKILDLCVYSAYKLYVPRVRQRGKEDLLLRIWQVNKRRQQTMGEALPVIFGESQNRIYATSVHITEQPSLALSYTFSLGNNTTSAKVEFPNLFGLVALKEREQQGNVHACRAYMCKQVRT